MNTSSGYAVFLRTFLSKLRKELIGYAPAYNILHLIHFLVCERSIHGAISDPKTAALSLCLGMDEVVK